MAIDLFAVVVNYRTASDLEDFLQSWVKFAPDWASLKIVNVCPEDEDRRVAGHYVVEHGVAHEWWETNFGYATACNVAVSPPSTYGERVLAFFNADVVLTERSIQNCYEALIGHDDWAILGPRQVDQHGKFTHAGIFGPLDKPKHRGWHEHDRGQYQDIRDDAPTVSGSAYFVKRSVWNELRDCEVFQQVAPNCEGAFLPTKHYYEETWCSYHCHAHGLGKVVYYGPVTMVHKWHKASPVGGFAEQQMSASQALFRQACDLHGILHD